MRYAADGSWNITIVDGTTLTGLIAPDGSINVVASDGSANVGITHPCGAMWVTESDVATSRYAADGSLNVTTDGTSKSASQKVTIVAGAF